MGSSNSNSSHNSDEQKSFDEAERFVKEHGVDGLDAFYREKLKAWENIELNFVVSGKTGAGKSAFINAIRG